MADQRGSSPASTHEITIDRARGVVTKRFRSWARNEPAREWAALWLLADHADRLAPRPLTAHQVPDPPIITMSWLPGDPLGESPVSDEQQLALAAALDRLWTSIPPEWLTTVPAAAPNPVAFASQVRRMLAAGPDLGPDPAVQAAAGTAAAWLDREDTEARWPPPGDVGLVLGQGDANLSNFLYDDGQVRLVDFEDSGPSDRPFELAILVEHLSAWADAGLDAGVFLARFDLTAAERSRLLNYRRLVALFWLVLLRPGGPASRRNPTGTLARQADRLLHLLA